MTTHRAFIFLCLSLAVLLLSGETSAQQRKVFRVGVLNLIGTPSLCMDGWRAAMRELGYIAGENIVFEMKYGAAQQLPALALELVRLKPDVIYSNSSPAVRAAFDLHSAVPIVALDLETDPVASGFALTLGHPGGNLTGLFLDLPEFGGKQLEILRETLPALSHVIVLWDRSMDRAPLSGIETAARALHLRLSVREVDDDSALPSIFEDATARTVARS